MTDARHAVALAAVAVRYPRDFHIARRAIRHHGAVQRTSELAIAVARVRRLEPRTVVEIGSHLGGTLHAWASVVPRRAILVSVDLEAPPCPSPSVPEDANVVTITGDSHDPTTRDRVKTALRGYPIDFLFIDGDHSESGVRADLQNFAPLTSERGVIGLHDIIRDPQRADCDVWKVWEELRRGHGVEEIVDPHGRQYGGMGIGLFTMTGEKATRWTDAR